ncbi:ash family protein [Escherichia coli]|uniref:ash family protein n=1 Tax=Escherichia coli TaxID=562 RepID=UPI0004D622F7|nr:ash family protein [Escherichia coli 3-373-03_S4_C2]KDU51548.1 ash family protein [Escherichia coli 3-373-03_S4_C1]
MLTVQKKTFSLAGMSPKSSNMTAKSGINTADTSKVYHLLVVGTDALTISEISGDDISIEKVSGCARKFLVVDDVFRSCSDSTKTFVHARDVNEMSAMYCASGASNSEFSESIKKSLPLCGNTVYGYKAPHKTGAGIGVLVNRMATYDAPSVFFYVVGLTHPFFGRWCIIQRLCQSMVAQAGASSEAPVSIRAGYANPVWATTSEIGVSGGSVTCYRMEAATCWLLPLPKNRNLSGLSPQFAAIARQLPPKFIILLPSLNAMLAVLWCAITSAFLLVVSAWRWLMIKTYDVHMDPLERTSQIITLTEVINDILASNSPSRDERLKALLAILDLAVRDVHFLLEGGEMPGKTGATNE